MDKLIQKKNKEWHAIKHKAFVSASLLWPIIDYKVVDMLSGYVLKVETKLKTTNLLQGITNGKDLGGYEKIDIINWRTSDVL